MPSALNELVSLFGAPTVDRRPNWVDVEERLGIVVPDDFKALVATFGRAVFCDSIEIYLPDQDTRFNLADATLRDRQFLTEDATPRPATTPDGKPFDPALLISWASDAGGGYWMWYPDPERPTDPDRYTVVAVTADLVFWDFFPGSTTAFLLDYVTGTTPPEGQPGHVSEVIDDGPPYVDLYIDGQAIRYPATI